VVINRTGESPTIAFKKKNSASKQLQELFQHYSKIGKISEANTAELGQRGLDKGLKKLSPTKKNLQKTKHSA
jgi:hypothetical protein